MTRGERSAQPARSVTQRRSSRPVERTRSASDAPARPWSGDRPAASDVLERARSWYSRSCSPSSLRPRHQDDVARQPRLRGRRPLLVGPLATGLTAVQPRPADRPLLGQDPAAPAAPALLAAPPVGDRGDGSSVAVPVACRSATSGTLDVRDDSLGDTPENASRRLGSMAGHGRPTTVPPLFDASPRTPCAPPAA